MSEALSLRLDSTATTAEDAARLIATDPALLAEAKALLPSLERTAKLKAGHEGVKAVIGRRFALYPQPPRSEGEAAAWWADYFDVLADVQLASLEAAMRAYVADPESEFMPKPGKLKELAFTTPSRAMGRYYRAKAAIEWKDPAAPFVPSEEDRAQIRRMAEETAAALAPPKPAKPTLPSIAGKADAGGVTPQMRAILARQRGEAA